MVLALLFVFGVTGRAMAGTEEILKELQALKERIEELEEKLEEQESLAKRQVAKTEKQIDEKVGEALEERFGTLEIHGGAVLYYQGSQAGELDGAARRQPERGRFHRRPGAQPGNPRCR